MQILVVHKRNARHQMADRNKTNKPATGSFAQYMDAFAYVHVVSSELFHFVFSEEVHGKHCWQPG